MCGGQEETDPARGLRDAGDEVIRDLGVTRPGCEEN